MPAWTVQPGWKLPKPTLCLRSECVPPKPTAHYKQQGGWKLSWSAPSCGQSLIQKNIPWPYIARNRYSPSPYEFYSLGFQVYIHKPNDDPREEEPLQFQLWAPTLFVDSVELTTERELPENYFEIHTRSERNGDVAHTSVASAMKEAKRDATIWKIAFTAPNKEKINLVKSGDDFTLGFVTLAKGKRAY